MLKFFRKYNKFILAFGAAFLMLAFLIEPTLSVFMRGPGDQPVGRVDGQRLTVADQQSAANELMALQRIHPAIGWLANDLAEDEPLKWLLMKHDARRMGLAASDSEVQFVLAQLGRDDDQLRLLAADMGASTDYVRQAVRNWLTIEQYRDLVLGQTHVDPIHRVQAFTYIIQGQQTGNTEMLMRGYMMLEQVFGYQRLSEPLIQHMLRDLHTNVSGQIALVDASRYLDQVEMPDDAEVQALFEQYRDAAPGQGEPYGFGYRLPARVKVEYLSVPINRVQQQVQIDEVDALSYYEENLDRFRRDADAIEPGEDEHEPYEQVRSQIIRELRDREARTLATRIVRAGQAMLIQDARRLEQQAGYRVVPEDYSPPSLRDVADQLEEQFGVRPEHDDSLTDDWVPVAELQSLPGLGQAHMSGRPDISFGQYVRSAYELEPTADNPLANLGLQVMMPSVPMAREDGSVYLFRLVEAQPSHAPESIDPVAEQVRRDAHVRKAYEAYLLPNMDDWLSRLRSEGFASLAEAEDLERRDLPPTPRRQADQRGRLIVPEVPGVGRSEPLIESMFELAEQASEDGHRRLAEADESERVGVAAVDRRLGLSLFRVDEYQPVSERQYRQLANSPRVASFVSQMVMGADADPLASLSMEAVQARVNFRPADREPVEDDTAPAGQQRRPGQI